MSRRSRSGVADNEDEAARMTSSELESEIQRCLWGFENGGTSQGRKAYFKRLVWLEQQREALFGVAAPRRVFRQR
jgi:hypothetical protein